MGAQYSTLQTGFADTSGFASGYGPPGSTSMLTTNYGLAGTMVPGTANTLVLEQPGARAYSAYGGQAVLRPPPTQSFTQQYFGPQAGNFDGGEDAPIDGRGFPPSFLGGMGAIEKPFDDGRQFQGRPSGRSGRSDGQMWGQVYGTRPNEVARMNKFQEVDEAMTVEPQEKNWFDSMIEDLAGV